MTTHKERRTVAERIDGSGVSRSYGGTAMTCSLCGHHRRFHHKRGCSHPLPEPNLPDCRCPEPPKETSS